MLIDYNIISEQSKVFLYPSSRKFYTTELEDLNKKISDFLNSFPVKIAYKIKYERFLIFFIEASTTISTELINNLVQFIQQLEKTYDCILLDKVNVCFKQGKYVQYQDMKRFRELIKLKSVSKKTVVFDNFIQTKHEFENYWEVNVTESWLSHLFK